MRKAWNTKANAQACRALRRMKVGLLNTQCRLTSWACHSERASEVGRRPVIERSLALVFGDNYHVTTSNEVAQVDEKRKPGRPKGTKLIKDPSILGMAADLELAEREVPQRVEQLKAQCRKQEYLDSFDCTGKTRTLVRGKCLFCDKRALHVTPKGYACCEPTAHKCSGYMAERLRAVEASKARNRQLKTGRPTQA